MDINEQPTPQVSVNPGTKVSTKIVIIVLILGLFASFRYGYVLGSKGYTFVPKDFKIVGKDTLPQTVDYSLLTKAIDVVNEKYIDRPVDQQAVLYGAVRGAVAAAGDQYTTFFDPKELEDFKIELGGSFEGIGAEIGKSNGVITIIAPLPDSPAKKAGLLAKDVIVSVDGQSTSDWSVDEAVNKIRGKHGTSVTLSIFREGHTKTFDVTIQRDTISVKSVTSETKTVAGKKIAVITISRFGDDTKDLLTKAINDALAGGVQGVILDLRNDPGGFLEAAVDAASNWVPKDKVVVTEAHSDTDKITYNSYGYGRLTNIKTVVLINGGSASAAEILAGALHDYKYGELIGEKSFGKGSVQELIDLPGNTAVKVTVAKWITPNGKNLNKDGLDPDVPVKLTEEDIAAGRDPQMDKALSEITK